MNETTTNAATETETPVVGTETKVETTADGKRKSTPADEASRKVVATAEERDANKPDNPNYKKVTFAHPTHGNLYAYADGYASAYLALGKHLGWNATIGKTPKPVDKVAVGRTLTDEELDAILAERGRKSVKARSTRATGAETKTESES